MTEDAMFAIGAVVRAKDGGPLMCVKRVDELTVVTQWFVEDDLHEEQFAIESLIKAD